MKIFISYRRADSKYVVDRIRDRLIVAYGEDSVFRDIESIPLGKDFSAVLNSETNGCDVMLVIIGPQWAGITDAQGNKRLFHPADYTRIEIETGLNHEEILVIPIMVMNATMPNSQDLPQSLSNLTYRNAISVRNDPDFDNDIKRLILSINQTKGGTVETITPEYFEPETVFIPQGSFWLGSDPGEGVKDYNTPRHKVSLPNYRISKYPVLNREYAEFVTRSETQISAPLVGFSGLNPKDGLEDQPVKGVTLEDARAYCKWLSDMTKRKYDLPNEAQLEKAYQGPYGCFDIIEDIYLWTCTLWGENLSPPDSKYQYPWQKDDGRNNPNANSQIRRVVCRYKKAAGADASYRESRSGQFPKKPLSPERYSFRVVMNF